jgi:hypothetical protein
LVAATTRVGGSNHPDVDFDTLPASHALHGVLLQEAQKLDLKGEGELAYLVKKERPAARLLDTALAFDVGPRERPLLVTEELTLQEVFRDSAAIDGEERALRPRAQAVECHGHQLLARSVLPFYENRRVRGGHLANGIEELEHSGALSDHALEAVGTELQPKVAVVALQTGEG